jgi:hypothetical protein
MASVAGSPEATPWAKAPSVASRAFCAALHPALGASSTPAPAVRAERTKVRRSMRSLMADAQFPLRARPTRTFTEWSQVQVGEPLGARA